MALLSVIGRNIYSQRYIFLILIVLALFMSLVLRNTQLGADGKEYLRWTHSLVFDQDIHLLNDFEAVGGSVKLTPTGYVFERVNIGAPLLWAPFYRASLFFLPTPTDPAQKSYPADTAIQLLWINFSSWLYPILAGLITIGALQRLFSARAVGLAIIAIVLGTPVLFYMITFPFSSHGVSIFLSSLLLYVWLSNRSQQSLLYYLTVGIVIGWMMTVASYNVVFFSLPACILLKEYRIQKNKFVVLKNGLATALGGLLGFAPQMIVWWFLFGTPFYSPYSGQLLWSEPYVLETLFSTFHGLFFYAPVLLLVLPGLWFWKSRHSWEAPSIGLVWLGLTYIVSINVAWWAGSSFGNRYFLTLTPFFVVGLSALIDQGKKWLTALMVACVLWTVGLYLQFLSGVGFTSDSVVFAATELAKGQITAFTQIATVLPNLWLDRPWLLVPPTALPAFVLVFLITSWLVYRWVVTGSPGTNLAATRFTIVAVSVVVIGFIGLAGLRGQTIKATLASQGFYDQPHPVIRREIKELAGKAGLVTRAMYHRQTNQPEKAIADLKLAAELWQQDDAEQPQRLYLGPKESVSMAPPMNLQLDYLGQARLIGYRITEVNDTSISGELYWEKLTTDKSGAEIRPIVRAFDQAGLLRGGVEIDFPFPAHYLPAGSIFTDNFKLEYAAPANHWLWLEVILADASDLPKNERGEPQTGFITSLIPAASLTAPPPAGAALPGPVGQLTLPAADLEAGQMLPLQWNWQNADRPSQDTHLQITLADPAGQTLVQQEYPLLNMEQEDQLDPGQPTPYQTLCLTLPDSLAPGEYSSLTARFQPPTAGRLLDATNKPVGALTFPLRILAGDLTSPPSTVCQLIKANFGRNYQPSAPQNSVGVLLTDAVELAGFDYFVIPQAEKILGKVILHWRIQKNVAQNYLVSVQLLNEAGQPVAGQTGPPQHGLRPSSTWLQGEWLLDEHEVGIPPLPPGRYRLILALIDEPSGQPVQLSGDQLTHILQEIEIP